MLLDKVDRQILHCLADDARMPIKTLAEQVGLSPPSAAERLRKLQERKVIEGFTLRVDPAALGYTMQAIVRIKPLPGQLKAVEALLQSIAELCECDKVTGEDCFIARVHLRSVAHLDEILEAISEKAETHSSIVKSQPVKRRLPGY